MSGYDDPLANIILYTARQNAQAKNAKMPRVPGPLRLFSVPFEAFLVNNSIGAKQPGRIDRGSVLKVWQWLARDLIPDELNMLADQIKSAMLSGDQEKARTLVEQLRVEAAAAINDVVGQFEKYPRDEARIAGQIGGTQALGDAIDIAKILDCADDIRKLQKRFSSKIEKFNDEEISWCLGQIDTFCEQYPEMLPHALVLIMQKLARPSEVVRLAKKRAGTDDAIKIEAHPYNVAIELVLYDARCTVKGICESVDDGRDVELIGGLVMYYHDLVHCLQIELEIPTSSSWSKSITQMRSKLSERLGLKLEEAPRSIKTALKVSDDPEVPPQQSDLDAAEYVLRLMNICRLAVDELALNELLSRVRGEVEQFVNVMSDSAVEQLRSSSEQSRAAAQARVDAAVKMTHIVFGDDAAELLQKAGNVARQAAEKDSDDSVAKSA